MYADDEWHVQEMVWSRSTFRYNRNNPLMPNSLYSGRTVSPLDSQNSVSKFGFCSLLFDYLLWFAMLHYP